MIYEDSKATGVYDCDCIGCFDVVYSHAGDVCRSCDEADCTSYDTCQQGDAYWDQFTAYLGSDE